MPASSILPLLNPRRWFARTRPPEGPGVYVLHFADGSFFVGSSTDIQRRLDQHAVSAKSEGTVFAGRELKEIRWKKVG